MKYFLLLFVAIPFFSTAQLTPFERSGGKESATYFQAIEFYKKLDKASSKILVKQMGPTDAGYPLHLVMVSADGKFDPVIWHKQKKVVILINNGIHPGEPDGIDASMMLARDISTNKIKIPKNIALAFIPVYNIGGCLNRNSTSRANQNGPLEYGFRGNSQNLDLNRDFTKCDTKEARSFTQIFHFLDPYILVDNHVSDGADYQHTMTLVTTQYDKLGTGLGEWLKNSFEPLLFEDMKAKGMEMVPYVNAFETGDPANGWRQFYDQPRYSSGYAALFQTIGFMPETHMLKPFYDRVRSTYSLMETMIGKASYKAAELISVRDKARAQIIKELLYPLSWRSDTSHHVMITFNGFQQDKKNSEVTGMSRMYYDRSRPFTKQVPFYDLYSPFDWITKPRAYIIPAGWQAVIELLRINNVKMKALAKDTVIEVEAYHIDQYKSAPQPYEKHHRISGIRASRSLQKIRFLKGDVWINTDQAANRYLVEMLEPNGEDSFMAWGFFDAILQQKEGYSDYRWEDVAAEMLKNSPLLRDQLNEKKRTDSSFAGNSSAQLDFIYKNSPYYEPAHLRYPVYRVPGIH